MEEIADSDLILAVGTDPVANQPVALSSLNGRLIKGKN